MYYRDLTVAAAAATTAASFPLVFDPQVCNGCNQCVEVCQVNLLAPNPVAGKPPLILFPDECWYGGCCVATCPLPGAITLHPSTNEQSALEAI